MSSPEATSSLAAAISSDIEEVHARSARIEALSSQSACHDQVRQELLKLLHTVKNLQQHFPDSQAISDSLERVRDSLNQVECKGGDDHPSHASSSIKLFRGEQC